MTLLKRLFCRRQWRVTARVDVPPAFARYYGNVNCRCDLCGKEEPRYQPNPSVL